MPYITATSPEQIPTEVRVRFWMRLLDGDSVSEIARYSYQDFAAADVEDVSDATPSAVRQVIEQGPPDDIRADPRYVHGVRAFWIGAQYPDDEGRVLSMTFAFQPWRLPVKVFQKALRAVRREFSLAHPDGTIDLQTVESVEMDVALRMIENKGYAAWVIDVDGRASAYDGQFHAETPIEPAPR